MCSGLQVQARGHVPELQVQVHDHHAHGRHLAQPDGDVGGDRGLADPAFGGEDADHQPLGAVRLAGRRGSVAGGERLAGPLQQHPDLGRVRRRAEDVADAGPHGQQDEVRIGLADQDDAELGKLDVEYRRQAQGVLHRHVRSQDQDLGPFLVEAGEELRRVRGIDEREGLQAARKAAGQRLADAGIEIRVRRNQDKAAHLYTSGRVTMPGRPLSVALSGSLLSQMLAIP